jgi:hypothetical protein
MCLPLRCFKHLSLVRTLTVPDMGLNRVNNAEHLSVSRSLPPVSDSTIRVTQMAKDTPPRTARPLLTVGSFGKELELGQNLWAQV